MASRPRFLIAFPFLVSFFGSIALSVMPLLSGQDEMEEWQALLVMFWWPGLSLAFSLFLIQRVSMHFKTSYAEAMHDRAAWRSGVTESFAAMACVIVATVVGAAPQTWWVVQLWPSKGVLMPPLGAIMLLQCLVTAWAFAVFTSTIAPGMRIGTLAAHLLFAAAFFGNWLLLRVAGNAVAIPYLGGNRIDAFSPLILYLQRFRFDRPVSRLHLMYASSLTLFAVGGMLLLVVSFVIASGRSRRAMRHS